MYNYVYFYYYNIYLLSIEYDDDLAIANTGIIISFVNRDSFPKWKEKKTYM